MGTRSKRAAAAVLALSAALVGCWAVAAPRARSSPRFPCFHAAHLDVYGTADAVGNVVGLSGTVVLAGLLLVPMREARRAHQSCELT